MFFYTPLRIVSLVPYITSYSSRCRGISVKYFWQLRKFVMIYESPDQEMSNASYRASSLFILHFQLEIRIAVFSFTVDES